MDDIKRDRSIDYSKTDIDIDYLKKKKEMNENASFETTKDYTEELKDIYIKEDKDE